MSENTSQVSPVQALPHKPYLQHLFDSFRAAAQEFVERVERGEVRSTYTYGKFKALLAYPVQATSGLVEYTTVGNPVAAGVYACRVPLYANNDQICKDEFLMWMDGRWSYVGSDQFYRGEVKGWIGPLQRRM
jgi:hypothetical protein